MALSGSVLKGDLKPAILAEIQANFPINASLLAAEKTLLQGFQDKLAKSIADGDGPVTVSHITGNAVVNPGTFAAPAGIAVTTPDTINGTTIAPGPLTGTGTVS